VGKPVYHQCEGRNLPEFRRIKVANIVNQFGMFEARRDRGEWDTTVLDHLWNEIDAMESPKRRVFESS
jgi:hypothetical protein